MKDRINRAKDYVINHRASFGYIVGLAVGGVIVHRYHLNEYQMKRWGLAITDEQLQAMLDTPNLVMDYDLPGIGKFELSSITASKLK